MMARGGKDGKVARGLAIGWLGGVQGCQNFTLVIPFPAKCWPFYICSLDSGKFRKDSSGCLSSFSGYNSTNGGEEEKFTWG